MTVKLLTEHHLKFLSLKGGCTGSSVSTLVKKPHCWKSHAAAYFQFLLGIYHTQSAHNFKTTSCQRNDDTTFFRHLVPAGYQAFILELILSITYNLLFIQEHIIQRKRYQ